MIRVVARADVICARACAPTRNDTEVRRVVDHRALSVRAVTLYNTAIRWCQCSFSFLLHFSFPCFVGTKKVRGFLFNKICVISVENTFSILVPQPKFSASSLVFNYFYNVSDSKDQTVILNARGKPIKYAFAINIHLLKTELATIIYFKTFTSKPTSPFNPGFI